MASEKKTDARAGQRYMMIRYALHMQGKRVVDMYRDYCAKLTTTGAHPVHYSVFYRVCQGKRKSRAVQRWIAGYLRHREGELWA